MDDFTMLLYSAIALGIPIVYYLYWNLFVGPQQAKYEQELAERRQEQALTDFSLNCKECGALAAPIPSTRNRYRCNKCGRQFTSSPHRL